MDVENLLTASLLSAPHLARAISLEPRHFQDKRNGLIVDALKRGVTNPLELNNEAKKQKIDIIEHLHLLPSLAPDDIDLVLIQRLQNEINESLVRSAVMSSINRTVAQLKDKNQPVANSLGELSRLITLANRQLLGATSPESAAILERAKSAQHGTRFNTGIDILDAATNGMKHGHVWIVNAPYKSFKTRVALNIAERLLNNNLSVSYIALEDNDVAFTNALVAIHGCIPEFNVETIHSSDYQVGTSTYESDVYTADEWLKLVNWRVYDYKHKVHNWKNFSSLVAADKMQYNTDLVIVDYLQAWSEERESLEQIAQSLVQTATESQVCILGLSQMSNQSISQGTASNILATKNSGSFGAACHVGIELRTDYEKCRFQATPELLSVIDEKVRVGSTLTELGVWIKTVRRGVQQKFYTIVEPWSGRIIYEHKNHPLSEFTWN